LINEKHNLILIKYENYLYRVTDNYSVIRIDTEFDMITQQTFITASINYDYIFNNYLSA